MAVRLTWPGSARRRGGAPDDMMPASAMLKPQASQRQHSTSRLICTMCR